MKINIIGLKPKAENNWYPTAESIEELVRKKDKKIIYYFKFSK